MTQNLPATHAEDLARAAEEAARRHPPVGEADFLSFRGGQLNFAGNRMPGDQALVIIVDDVFENNYFPNAYDPNRADAPTCYAFGKTLDEMGPHPSMQAYPEVFHPQSPNWKCSGCPHNEWGSKGRGKACSNKTRIALLPAGYFTAVPGSNDFDRHIVDDPNHYRNAKLAFAKLAIGASKEFVSYVQTLHSTKRIPPFGAITRLYMESDPKYQYVTKFEFVEPVSSDLLPVIFERHNEASAQLVRGYSPPKS